MPNKPYGKGYRCHECNRLRRKDPDWELKRTRTCPVCSTVFDYGKASKIYCSVECNNALEPERMSNPRRFFQSALSPQRTNDGLTADDLLEILERQGGRCALTGKQLTFVRGKGAVDTNASIDRLQAGGLYTKENIQLVCSAVNSFRRALSVEDFVSWCEAVVEHKAKGGRR